MCILIVLGLYVTVKVVYWLLKIVWYAFLILVGLACLSFIVSFASRLL